MSDALYRRAKELLLRHGSLEGITCEMALITGEPTSNGVQKYLDFDPKPPFTVYTPSGEGGVTCWSY